MAVVQINNVPSEIKPGDLRRLVESELEITRFYLRPKEILPGGDCVKDGQYEVGYFETPDANKARVFVERHNGLHMSARTGVSSRKLPPRLRSAIWSLTMLNEGWDAANRTEEEREAARDRIIEGEMAQLGSLNQQYLEALEGDKRHKAGIVTVDEIKCTVPQIQYVAKRERGLDTISWVAFM